MSERKWCWSTDDEHFNGSLDSRDEAIGEAMAENPDCTSFDIGRAKPLDVLRIAKTVTERIGIGEMVAEEISDLVGDSAEDTVDSGDETSLECALAAVISAWVGKHYGHFFEVVETENVIIAGIAK